MALSCKSCTAFFDEGDMVPIVLPCGHTFCRQCVMLLDQCPTDGSALLGSRSCLPTNFLVLEQLAGHATLDLQACILEQGSMAVEPHELDISATRLDCGAGRELWRGRFRSEQVCDDT